MQLDSLRRPAALDDATAAAARRLVPATAVIEDHWGRLVEKVALMLAAYEATERAAPPSAGPPPTPVAAWSEALGIAEERVGLLLAVADHFRAYSGDLASQPEASEELALLQLNLGTVVTCEVAAPGLEAANELYWGVVADRMRLEELAAAVGFEHEACSHTVATLRARVGWQPVAFGAVGEVFRPGLWDGRYPVVQVRERRAANAQDARVREDVIGSLARRQLVRSRESVDILLR
jgi:hypothetical protein